MNKRVWERNVRLLRTSIETLLEMHWEVNLTIRYYSRCLSLRTILQLLAEVFYLLKIYYLLLHILAEKNWRLGHSGEDSHKKLIGYTWYWLTLMVSHGNYTQISMVLWKYGHNAVLIKTVILLHHPLCFSSWFS